MRDGSRPARELLGGAVRPMVMDLRWLVLMTAAVVAGGCTGDAPPPDAAVTKPPLTPTPTTPAPTTPDATVHPVEGEWEESTAVLVTAGIATQSDNPPDPPDVHVIGSTSAGYLVAGSVNGGFAVWRSTDLESFDPVYSEICCDRYLRASSIGEFAGSILVGGTAEFRPERNERAFLLRSDDGGTSWTLIDDPLFTTDANRMDQIVVTDEGVLVATVDDRRSETSPRSVAAWSDDLVAWHPVELPDAHADDWPWFVNDDEVVYAIAQRYDGPENWFTGRAIWRSNDGGQTFTASPLLERPETGALVVARGALVALPSVFQDTYRHADAQGHAVLGDHGAWQHQPVDTGTWGDDWVSMYISGTGGSPDRTYALVSRTTRASVHYCYTDVETCRQRDDALVVTEDGSTWSDVAGFPAPTPSIGNPMTLDTRPDGSVVVLIAAFRDPADRDSEIHVTRWIGTGPPPQVDRPGYPPPDIPIPLYDHVQPLEVGEERRYVLGLGGCGGMHLDGRLWEPETPLVDPPPPNWPYRDERWEDGPTGFVYGRVERLATDVVEFSIEGIGPVATFRPAPEPEFVCG